MNLGLRIGDRFSNEKLVDELSNFSGQSDPHYINLRSDWGWGMETIKLGSSYKFAVK